MRSIAEVQQAVAKAQRLTEELKAELAKDSAITPTTSIPLARAVELFFPGGLISVASLRRDLNRFGLIHRIANKDLTTPAAIEELKIKCRVQAKAPVSRSTKAKAEPACGTSATGSDHSAQDALKANAKKLRESLQRTSSKSTTPGQASAEVIRMRSRSRTHSTST